MSQRTLLVGDADITANIFGSFDRNTALLEAKFGVRIYNRPDPSGVGDAIVVDGDEASVALACEVLKELKKLASVGEEITQQRLEYTVSMVSDGRGAELASYDDGAVYITPRGKPIKPKTVGQGKYIELIRKNTIVLGVGPAGTGKTYLAVMMAIKALRAREVSRIILTRPAVEAGERLGFLPGDLQSKIDPYLRPLYDALYDMLGAERCLAEMEKGVIEIAPLAYMRGRTLEDSFVILDEAQNTTPEQMKMFLTRLGGGSKMVVTGDLTQTDLPFGQKSGLSAAVRILRNIEDIGIHEFSDRDVVRHRLVQRIIAAYDKYDRERAVRSAEAAHANKAYRPKSAPHRDGRKDSDNQK